MFTIENTENYPTERVESIKLIQSTIEAVAIKIAQVAILRLSCYSNIIPKPLSAMV